MTTRFISPLHAVAANRLSGKTKRRAEKVTLMKNGKTPDPNVIHPIPGYEKEIYVKPTITRPNIIVGDLTYIADMNR